MKRQNGKEKFEQLERVMEIASMLRTTNWKDAVDVIRDMDNNGIGYILEHAKNKICRLEGNKVRYTPFKLLNRNPDGYKSTIIIPSEHMNGNQFDMGKMYVDDAVFTTSEVQDQDITDRARDILGDSIFIGSLCTCGEGNFASPDIISELIQYGDIFADVNLDGCGILATGFYMGEGDELRTNLENVLSLPVEERVREFTRKFVMNPNIGNHVYGRGRYEGLTEEQLEHIHLIPVWKPLGAEGSVIARYLND